MKKLNINFLSYKEHELQKTLTNHINEYFMELHKLIGVGFESGQGVITDLYLMDYSDHSYNPFFKKYNIKHNDSKITLKRYFKKYDQFSNGRNIINVLIHHLMYLCEQDLKKLNAINKKFPFSQCDINIKPNMKLLNKNINILSRCSDKYIDSVITDKLFNDILNELSIKTNIKYTVSNTEDYKMIVNKSGELLYDYKIFSILKRLFKFK